MVQSTNHILYKGFSGFGRTTNRPTNCTPKNSGFGVFLVTNSSQACDMLLP